MSVFGVKFPANWPAPNEPVEVAEPLILFSEKIPPDPATWRVLPLGVFV